MATLVVSSRLFRLISLSVLLWTASSVPPTWAETIVSDVEPAPAAEQGESAAAEAVEPADAPISPSVQLSGSIWRSKPGIVFLQTPIGPLSLSSKTTLRDIRGSQKITLWIHGSTTVIDIREKGAGTLVHRYVTGMPNFSSPEKKAVTLWTPDGEQSFTLGAFETKIAGRPDHLPFTVEVDGSGAVRGLHDVQFDLQVNQIPRTPAQVRMLVNGTVSKLKSNYVFLKTPLGIVTVSGKTGVRNAKVGQEMSVWIQERYVAIDLYQDGLTTPSRRFLSGPLTYASAEHDRLTLQTPEGEQSVPLRPRPASLAALKEGMPITVELDQQGALIDIRRVN
ncbi:MAG: hypothetical protein OJF52_003743 [Nitrospira sp.]|jgi:hypothetical protein|nr:MAG: hypothetical protein OJF52_003743 [Nitrospira sp.]